MTNNIPSDAPPSYAQATGPTSSSSQAVAGSFNDARSSSHLSVPGAGGAGGVPSSYRRSMEDEQRPLPTGWVRTFDPKTKHQFFVDTTKDPPRSIWQHPHDDEEYLNTLTGEERERVEQDSINYRGRHHPSTDDYIHADSDVEEDQQHGATGSSPHSDPPLPPRPDGKDKAGGQKTFGRKLKDKVTGTTHEEREKMRARRAEEERRAYEMHLRVRQAMQRAAQTGQAQHLGKDRDGREIYIQPPQPTGYGGGYGGGHGYPFGGGYGGNGVYTTPNARYITPQQPYGRPSGGGFGGGYGMPLAIGGGLLGGLLLGDLLF